MYRDDVISFVDDDNDDEGSLWAVPYEYMLHTEIHTEIGVYDTQRLVTDLQVEDKNL